MTVYFQKKQVSEDKLLTKFEKDLYELINSLKLCKYLNFFTQKLKNGLKEIKFTKKFLFCR